MLYKKIHRQYLREFRKGRRFKWFGSTEVVTKNPDIDGNYIWVGDLFLIHLPSGRIRHKNDIITWLE